MPKFELFLDQFLITQEVSLGLATSKVKKCSVSIQLYLRQSFRITLIHFFKNVSFYIPPYNNLVLSVGRSDKIWNIFENGDVRFSMNLSN